MNIPAPDPEASAAGPSDTGRPQIIAYGLGEDPVEVTEIRTVDIRIEPTRATQAADGSEEVDEGTWTVSLYPSSARKRRRTVVPDELSVTGANHLLTAQVETLIQGARRAGHTIMISAGEEQFVASPATPVTFEVVGDNPGAPTEVLVFRRRRWRGWRRGR